MKNYLFKERYDFLDCLIISIGAIIISDYGIFSSEFFIFAALAFFAAFSKGLYKDA